MNWRVVFPNNSNSIDELQAAITAAEIGSIYPKSVQVVDNSLFFMVNEDLERKLVVVGALAEKFTGEEEQIADYQAKVCSLTPENLSAIQEIFPWTKPQAFGPNGASIGLGDRLGLASPGHIATVRNRAVKPILAQQSIRELDLTGRDYPQVLAAAAWAVFEQGFTTGYGADGDHLKKPNDVQMAIDLGFSMITLDCSEHIDDTVGSLTDDQVVEKYQALPDKLRSRLETEYLNQSFTLASGTVIKFTADDFRRMVVIYHKVLDFAEQIYNDIIQPAGRDVDFEVSIDEVATPTTPQDHFFVANELIKRGVKVNSVAPRFCGEFQKGIDYIGDINQFEAEFKVHAEIADHFGYKVSVHSGSDKFAVFGIVGKYTKGRYHVKTAGTNWLEAVRVIAEVAPDLYRKMHLFALNNLNEAKKYYHVTFDPNAIPDVTKLADDQLPNLMNQNDARQALHITYGLILQAKAETGNYLFRDEIYKILLTHRDLYSSRLQQHIGKHLDLLNTKKQ
ncbi:MAG: hypothetical protein GX208_08940 [Firmicutes bacterium]|nr:hypothetical protein [Bacillota bacterium]